MARINWKNSAPYEHIVGKETGEKIYTIMEYLGVEKKHEALRFAIDFTCKALIEKPFKPAEPERKKGEWIDQDAEDIEDYPIEAWQSAKCSVCGKYHTTPYKYNFDNYPYCPNCGAEMKK